MVPVRHIHRLILTVLLTLAVLSGCGPVEKQGGPHDGGIDRSYSQPPITLMLSTDKSEMATVEKLYFSLHVLYPEDYEIKMPTEEDELDKFRILSVRDFPQKLTGDQLLESRRDYVLEPFLAGEYLIPKIEVAYGKKSEQIKLAQVIASEPITIRVNTLFADDQELKLHDISGPLSLPHDLRGLTKRLLSVLLILLALVGLVLLIIKRRADKKAIPAVIPAHRQAFNELDKLWQENKTGKISVKEFYYKISMILRCYIENRFGLRAPEQTTEEFIAAIVWDTLLLTRQKEILKEYMKRCDMVKFAEVRPSHDDVLMAYETCRGFVVETMVNDSAKENAQDAV